MVIKDFTVQDIDNRTDLIAEALEIIEFADISLGDRSEKKASEDKKSAIEYIKKFDEDHATFSPKLTVTEIDLGKWNTVENSDPTLESLLGFNRLFKVRVPITLFPRSGWAFTRLECWLGICPQETQTAARPVIYDMFPDDSWTQILSFGQELLVGLDEQLQFKAELSSINFDVDELSAMSKLRLSTELRGSAVLGIGPFKYNIRRSNILGRGRGNVECFWRMDGKSIVSDEDVKLDIILQVPKIREDPVDIYGELRARHDFQLLSADVLKDWFPYFGEAIRSLLGNGLPVTNSMKWENILEGNA